MKTTVTKVIALTGAVWILSACTGQNIPQDATTPDKAASVSLELDKKHVRRYDCDGNLVSDQIETVSSPTALMNLHPTRPTSVSYSISGSSFTDLETSSSPAMITDNVEFWIDHGNGALGMHVITGMNEIQYRFSFSDGNVETGSRFIRVNYTEKLLPGIDEDRPSPESCGRGGSLGAPSASSP